MDAFWKGQDVFVNVSEYEGTSLSMLEAMGYGCVPVVTDVSGAREFIAQEKTAASVTSVTWNGLQTVLQCWQITGSC